MKNRKKILAFLLTLCLLISFAACGADPSEDPSSQKESEVSSAPDESEEPDESDEPDESEDPNESKESGISSKSSSKKTTAKKTTTSKLPTKKTVRKTTTTTKKNSGGVVKNYKNTLYSPCIQYKNPLGNTYLKLTGDKKLTVVYYGGSITAGDGSSNSDTKSWRALTDKWFKANFPAAKITSVNSAIPGQGTSLAVRRLQRDVLDKKPDLVFLEYAINDSYGDAKASVSRNFETIVRTIRTTYPYCDIVVLLTTDKSNAPLTAAGKLYMSAQVHNDLSVTYNASVLNVGYALLGTMGDSWSSKWSTYFSDEVHPADAGHKTYYLCVEEYLKNELLCTDYTGYQKKKATLPAVKSDHLMDGDAKGFYGEDMQELVTDAVKYPYASGTYFTQSYVRYNKGFYTTKKADFETASITFTFTGTELAIWSNLTYLDKVSCSVDGGSFKTVDCSTISVLTTGLANGKHTVCLKPIGVTKDTMRIGAIFTRNEEKQTTK